VTLKAGRNTGNYQVLRGSSAMQGKSNFVYHEIPKGGHDAALWVDIDLQKLNPRTGQVDSVIRLL